jgi:hypothetical protein
MVLNYAVSRWHQPVDREPTAQTSSSERNFVMRNLFIIGMLLVGAFMAGWFKVNRDGERTTIEINRNEIRGDARNAINRGREFLDRRDQQYADQQYADQQYADQQYAEGGQQAWPQEQVAAQQDAWGTNFDYQQQQPNINYQAQPYQNQPQDQRYPIQTNDPQQQYQPQQYLPANNR